MIDLDGFQHEQTVAPLRGGLREAAEFTGLSMGELRRGALAGRYPVMRIGGPRGRFWFDFHLLENSILQLMAAGLDEPSEPNCGVRPVDLRAAGR